MSDFTPLHLTLASLRTHARAFVMQLGKHHEDLSRDDFARLVEVANGIHRLVAEATCDRPGCDALATVSSLDYCVCEEHAEQAAHDAA